MKKILTIILVLFITLLFGCNKKSDNTTLVTNNKTSLTTSTTSKNITKIITTTEEKIDLEIILDEDYLEVNKEYGYSFKDDIKATLSSESKNIVITDTTIKLLSEEEVTLVATYKNQKTTKDVYGYIKSNEITTLPRDSYYVNYFGRNVHDGEKVIMNNGGNGFEVTFYGTKLTATMDAWYGSWYGKTKVAVMIDGNTDYSKKKSSLTLIKSTTKYEYTLCSGLTEGYHTVKVYKKTEGISTDLSLYDIKTDGYFLPVDKTEKLNIEVYGDSITAGYGNLRGELSDTTSSEYQNAMETYAGYLVNTLDANVNMMARTGIGLYTASSIQDGNNVIDLYDKTSYEGTNDWNFNNFIPDIVLINLGTNDNWNTSKFNQETFISYYIEFVKTLAEIYGSNTSFILLSGFMETDVKDYLEYVIYYLESEIENSVYQFTFDKCNGGHPLNTEHYAAAVSLTDFIKENGLDVHYSNDEKKEYSLVGDKEVEYELTIETSDALKDYLNLYVTGLNETPIQLTKISDFKYHTNVSILEGDYELSIYLNENADSKSIGSYIAHVRENNNEETIKINSFINVPEDPNPYSETYGWTTSKHLFTVDFSATENTIDYYNENWMAGFAYHKASLSDNYEYTLNIKGDYLTSIDQVFAGFCPYYIDDQNYVVIYLQWNSDGTFKSFGCTGRSEGADIGWNDYWSFSNKDVDLTKGVDIIVSRTGTNLTISMMGTTETKSLACMSKDSKYYAIWGVYSHMEVSNITIKEVK